MARFVRRPPERHRCALPQERQTLGTVWECDCGRRYKVVRGGTGRRWRPTVLTFLGLQGKG